MTAPTQESQNARWTTKTWEMILIVSAVLGFVLGLWLRESSIGSWAIIIGLIGYLSAIVSIGTSNIFQDGAAKHFTRITQRWIACIAAFAMAAAIVTIES